MEDSGLLARWGQACVQKSFWKLCWAINFPLNQIIIMGITVIFREFLNLQCYHEKKKRKTHTHTHCVMPQLSNAEWVKHHVLAARKITSQNLLALNLAVEECPSTDLHHINKWGNTTAVLFLLFTVLGKASTVTFLFWISAESFSCSSWKLFP